MTDPQPQRFALSLRMGAVEIEDAGWATLDPAGALSRTPAEFRLDLTGSAVLEEDLGAEGAAPPDSANAQLEIRGAALGAELDVSGNYVMKAGMIGPSGTTTIAHSGVVEAVKALGSAGMIDVLQSVAILGALQLSTWDGAEEGWRETVIETSPEGTVRVNGLRVR